MIGVCGFCSDPGEEPPKKKGQGGQDSERRKENRLLHGSFPICDTLSTCLEIVEFNLDTLDSFCWMSGRIPVAAHLKTLVATEGMRKLRPKKPLRCGRDKKIHVQKSIRFQFNRKGSSSDHMMSYDVPFLGFHQAAAEAARREEELKAEETENQAESSGTKTHVVSPWLKTVSSSQWKVRNS